ncbi:MAG: methylmalonyl Co-A mutase-associated GTPase MeaB [Anaerolineales bacterium]|nr:MAG: methylmalonyl Co-A mutase-associated GTPase MeaB [Anaerolineales bacterium]
MSSDIVKRVLAGDRRAVARLITMIENDGDEARRALADLYPYTGQAHIVGVTGAPGTGKSTLVNELAKVYRGSGGQPAHSPRTVGIIAVDPTSPFSGGAILGDRIRMRELSGDPGIFIRSMATRGSLGGLARATADAIKVLDAAGYEVIFVETVGAGQAEVDIAKTAHTTIVIQAPGLGDDIQAIKAGILEIADIFAVNKADREGADNAVMALQMLLDLDHASRPTLHHGVMMGEEASTNESDSGPAPSQEQGWRPPILKTVALHSEGIEAVVEAIEAHLMYLKESQTLYQRERERIESELNDILQQELMRRLLDRVKEGELDDLIQRIGRRELDPYSAVRRLIEGEQFA